VRVAPTWVRRPFTVGVVVGLSLLLSLAPLLLLDAAVLSPLLPGRWRPLRVLAFLLVYLVLELVALVVAVALWYASGFGWQLRSPSYQAAHYAVLRLVLRLMVRAARWLFRLHIRTDDCGWSPLDDGVPGSDNAMLVLSRHAGPGDSFLLVNTLMDRDHRRRPRIVLKDTLQLDPVVDVYLNRLPSGFLAGRPGRPGRAGRRAGSRPRRRGRAADLPGGRQLHPGPTAARHRLPAGQGLRRAGSPRRGDAARAAAPAGRGGRGAGRRPARRRRLRRPHRPGAPLDAARPVARAADGQLGGHALGLRGGGRRAAGARGADRLAVRAVGRDGRLGGREPRGAG
jgi:hypothetical protein